MKTAFPFPTVWPAGDEITCLLGVLPSEDDIMGYLDSFQRRVQACFFPHMPEECTQPEIKRFLANVEHHAVTNSDMFALLFATMAQGLQNGIYDRCGERWIAGAVDVESQRGDVFGRSLTSVCRPTKLTLSSRCRHAGIEDGIIPLAANDPHHPNLVVDRTVSHEQR